MPARGFACRAARTKTAKHACESLIPPVVIQHPSLLWLHSHPFHLTVSRPIRAWFFPGFARDELCIVWEFFIVRLQTNLRHRADFSFIRSSIPALHIDFTLFFFNLFLCFFSRLCVHPWACAFFLFSNLLSCFFHLCILILMTTLFCFKVPDFFCSFFYLPSIFFSSPRHRINFWWNIQLKCARHERFI